MIDGRLVRAFGAVGAIARSEFVGGGKRVIGPTRRVYAELRHDGDSDRGTANGQTRTVNGLIVTNHGSVSVWVEVESESTQETFSATIPPGKTVNVLTTAIQQYWNTERRIPGWDGLNIRWKDPA